MFGMKKVFSNVKQTTKILERSLAENAKPFNKIPGPFALPLIGTLPLYIPKIGKYEFMNLPKTYHKMHEEYGDLVREYCGYDRTVVHVYNPNDMMTVYNSDGNMPRRKSHSAVLKYRKEKPHLYSGPGMVPSNDKEWADFRNMFKRALANPTILKQLTAPVETVTNDLIEAISNNLDENNETDLSPLLYRWGLETIAYISLDQRLGCFSRGGHPEAPAVIQAAEDIHECVLMTEVSNFQYRKFYKKLVKSQTVLEKTVKRQLDIFLATKGWEDKECIVKNLMKSEGADIKSVFTMLMDMFLAGIDSSSFTLSFILYNLAKNPGAQQKLRQELMQAFPTPDINFNTAKIHMKYLFAVFKESLRINPIAVGIGRLLNKDLVLSGYHVPKDTMVILQHQVACKSEKNYKDADKFIPERWFDLSSRSVAHMPFGFGARNCIGVMIAQHEILVALSKLVLNYEMSYHYEPIGSKSVLLNIPDKPLRFQMRRLTPH